MPCSNVSIDDFEQIIADWDYLVNQMSFTIYVYDYLLVFICIRSSLTFLSNVWNLFFNNIFGERSL